MKYAEVQGSSKKDTINPLLAKTDAANRKVASTTWFQPNKVLDEKPWANLENQSAVPLFYFEEETEDDYD